MNLLSLLISLFLLHNIFLSSSDIKSGDIIFKITDSDRSKAIQLATHSKYTHMGIVVYLDNKPFVFHASSITTFDPYYEWIESGIDQHYVVKRLKSHPNGLNNKEEIKLIEVIESLAGLSYDDYFEISDERMYCSELVWKIYKRFMNIEIGKLKKLKDYDIKHNEVKELSLIHI